MAISGGSEAINDKDNNRAAHSPEQNFQKTGPIEGSKDFDVHLATAKLLVPVKPDEVELVGRLIVELMASTAQK